MPRKSGGQPRNRNAYKHGFYARFFTPGESRLISKTPLADLTGEVDLLRVNVDRFMQAYMDSLDNLDYARRLDGLRAITLAVGRIAALQRFLSSPSRNTAYIDQLNRFLAGIPEDVFIDDEPPAELDFLI